MTLLATETILVILLLALGIDAAGSTAAAATASSTALGAACQLLVNGDIESVRFVRARRAEFGAF